MITVRPRNEYVGRRAATAMARPAAAPRTNPNGRPERRGAIAGERWRSPPRCRSVGTRRISGFIQGGLRAELHRDRILVTTVCPGLMHTGSPRNAMFKGRHRQEHAWFAVTDSLPLLSMNAQGAGRKIVAACRHGTARVVLGWPAKLAVRLNELRPGTTARWAARANRLLPPRDPNAGVLSRPGYDSTSTRAPSILTRTSNQAALRNNEVPGIH